MILCSILTLEKVKIMENFVLLTKMISPVQVRWKHRPLKRTVYPRCMTMDQNTAKRIPAMNGQLRTQTKKWTMWFVTECKNTRINMLVRCFISLCTLWLCEHHISLHVNIFHLIYSASFLIVNFK